MYGHNLAKQTLDQIPEANANAKRIVGIAHRGKRNSNRSICPTKKKMQDRKDFRILHLLH